MADSKAHALLSVTPPNQISKDIPGFDTSIPLSPQWLLPKPGESKVGMAPGPGGNHSSPYAESKNHADIGNLPGGGEKGHDRLKKKDVYRPTFLETESTRRDRWRDEERETNMSIRRDRWRDNKEIGDTRKMDRWTNNSPAKNLVEARRQPSERWIDPSREAGFDQRRESKWNTRWGPYDKEMDRRIDFGKYGDASHDRGVSHLMNHGKDDSEGDHVRPWRPSSTLSRGRSDLLHHQSLISSKEGNSFGHGHGRGDSSPQAYSLGRGRTDSDINSNAKIPTLGQSLDKADNAHGQFSSYRYDKRKLLHLYGVTHTRLSPNLLDGFSQVPSLTVEEQIDPLALSAPTPEELDVIRGIDKGEIISSGAPQKSKDVSVGQGSSDVVQTRCPRPGSRDDVYLPDDGSNKNGGDSIDVNSGFSVNSLHDRQTPISGSITKLEYTENCQGYADNKHIIEVLRDGPPGMVDDKPRNRQPDIQGNALAHSSTAWKTSVEHPHSSTHGWYGASAAVQSKALEISWSEAQKNLSGYAKSSYPQNEQKWQTGEHSSIRSQQPVQGDRDLEARKLLQPSPEELILYYKDPQGQVQGPFSGIDIIGWFEAGYFGIDLLVRSVNAPPDSPFSLLGDVMPHLRAKARPPPGFTASKPNEMPHVSTLPALGNIGKVLTGPNGIDMIRNEQKHAHGSMTEAENKFLESLMSSSMSNSSLDRFSTYEGSQGYTSHNSSTFPPLGMESGDSLNLLAKRLTLERQKSLSNSYPNWPVKDASLIVPQSEMLQDSSLSQPRVLSSINDMPHQPSPSMPVLQGLHDNSTVSVQNGVGGWSNFAVQENTQNLPPQTFGLLQQRVVQSQNHPSLAHLLSQTLDSPSNIVNPEMLLSSGLSQDPQILNMLQQRQLLQMQPQTSVTAQQLSLLDKVLLVKLQQKQEEQLRLQQQQLLLSQVLTEHHQRFGEPPYGQLHPAVAAASSVASTSVSTPVDHLRQMLPHHILQVGPQVPVSRLQEDRSTMFADTPSPSVSQEISYNVAADVSSMPLPHHTPENHGQSCAAIPAQDGEIRPKDSCVTAAFAEGFSKPEAAESFQVNLASPEQVSQIHMMTANTPTSIAANEAGALASESSEISHAKLSEVTSENETSVPEWVKDTTGLPSTDSGIKEEQSSNVTSITKEDVKHAEVPELRKTSEKKSKKQKSSKAQTSSEQAKSVAKSSSQQLKQTQTAVTSETKSDVVRVKPLLVVDNKQAVETPSFSDTPEARGEVKSSEYVDCQNTTENSVHHRVWKPTVNVKPKSLLEIQQEEEKKVKSENAVSAISSSVSALSLSAPWAGIISSSGQNLSRENILGVSSGEINVSKTENKKSQLHDLLAAEVLAKSREKETATIELASTPSPLPIPSSQADIVDDDFIEAKEMKKSRKKAGKAKTSGSKSSTVVSSVDAVVSSSPIEKAKSSRKVQQEREVLPAPPVGPSLSDFVPWKGEATSPSPAPPAWFTDSGKLPKPTSLRDILIEEERRGGPTQKPQQLTTPQKTQPMLVSHTIPSKASAPVQISSQASPQTKFKGEDDLFWGPLEHSKQEGKNRPDFPQLGNSGSWGTKSTPVKATSGASLSSKKSAGRMTVEILSSHTSTQLPLKATRDGDSKHSEAMEFRGWCESESVRLTGSNDTSFLEFCLKQSRSEAEILLIQNLGGVDTNHKFIEKFLNYMDMLPADVLNIAFQGQNGKKAYSARDMTADNTAIGNSDITASGVDGSAKGGKKKGKKGKKVSPFVLGFNVVSNRIMMGEIQTVDD